ncbi:hypothetical protein JCM10449v2_007887 [Rhodotorula kratochvilovae]
MLQLRVVQRLRAPAAVRPAQRRRLWRCSTFISSSPSSLLARLEEQPAPAKDGLTLFALSKNTPQDLVPRFVAALRSPSSPSPSSIGVLSEVLPSSALAHLAPSNDLSSELYSIAVARHSPSSPDERALPFRSTLTGRPNIALGREIRPELHDEGEDAGFEAFLRGEKWGFGDRANAVNGREEGIEELKGVDSSQVKEVVAFTADRIQPFLAALSSYPSAAKAGLVGSSTPFHSPMHAPYSLFYGDEIVSSGAVGVAVVGSPSTATAQLDYGGLQPVGEPYEVTSSQGNIVLTLSSQNAARLLLNAVNQLFGTSAANLSAVQRSEEKEKEFFAAVFDHAPSLPLDLSKARLVARIMAGDPSRGAMSVETEEEVSTGSYLAFLHSPSAPAPSPPSPADSLSFLSVAPSDAPVRRTAADAPAQAEVIELDAFVTASENGVLLASGAGGAVRVCAIEGASVRVVVE